MSTQPKTLRPAQDPGANAPAAVDARRDAPRIACFFSTSGHSGVDRAAKHLIPALAHRGYAVDSLKVRRHGPNLDPDSGETPAGVRIIDLGSGHTYACLPALVRYLRRERPAAMLSDKDRVNRTALLARALAHMDVGHVRNAGAIPDKAHMDVGHVRNAGAIPDKARVQTRLVLSSGTTISIDLATRGPVERWVQRNSMGRLYPFADLVIVTSAGVADDMASYTGLPRDLIRVVPSPVVPASLFAGAQPRPDHPWFGKPGWPLILSAGELCGRKGFDTLLRAFARVRARRPCRLMILGRGGALEALLSLAAELGVAEDFALPGFVPQPYAWMAHADLFAFSSRWEGLGFVLIEALAVGTPVVSTDCPSGPREVLDGGRYGHLVAVDDDEALAAAMMATLDAPLPPEILRQAARPYEIEASTDAYLDALGLPHHPGGGLGAGGP